MLPADWLLVVNRDGVVESALGGAPQAWVARRVEDCPGLPEVVRARARTLTRELAGPLGRAMVRRERVEAVTEGGPSFTLIGVEAVLLRAAEVPLVELCARAFDPLARQAAALGVRLEVDLAEARGCTVSVDADKIAWALAALVGNALRFVRRGEDKLPGGTIRAFATANAARHMVSITVQDDGPGIASELRPWLFEPNPETGRTVGVGLRLVHDIVAAHGGGMVLKSSAEPRDRGTTVTLWLPLSS